MNYNKSMKFERGRNNQAPPSKYDLDNQQFLTFRNNQAIQNTGRTVYSQQFDYKSLDRYQKQEQSLANNFNFRKNLKNLRSQDKYKQLKEQALLFQATQENNESQFVSQSQRAEELKNKLSRIKKNLKRQQKRQMLLKKDITLLSSEIEQFSEVQVKHQSDINELVQILKDNQKNIGFMNRKLQTFKAKQKQLQKQSAYLQNTIQEQMRVKADTYSSQKYQKSLSEGIISLEGYIVDTIKKIQFFEEQINRMQQNLNKLYTIDRQLMDALND